MILLDNIENISKAEVGDYLISPKKKTKSKIVRVRPKHFVVTSPNGKTGLKEYAVLLRKDKDCQYQLEKKS